MESCVERLKIESNEGLRKSEMRIDEKGADTCQDNPCLEERAPPPFLGGGCCGGQRIGKNGHGRALQFMTAWKRELSKIAKKKCLTRRYVYQSKIQQ